VRGRRRVRDSGLAAAGRAGAVTFAEGIRSTDASVPGPVPLLHVRDHAEAVPAPFQSMDEVLEIAWAGAELGCRESLITLGDRPRTGGRRRRSGWTRTATTRRSPTCGRSIRILEETGLLPHVNPRC
jgi:FO synthase